MKFVKLSFEPDRPAMKPSRDGYGDGLNDAAAKNPDVVAIGADITASTRVDWFVKEHPDSFYDLGIAEQNQMAFAAGMSLMGKVPFVCNYGVFLAGRAWDQIRTTVCYNNLNVKLGGAHGGISVGPDGATHQALEEISLMRCLPNMKVIVPADYWETRKATGAVAEKEGPYYVRFGREKVPVITDESTPFEIGKAYCVREGTDVALIACGVMVYHSILAAEELAKEGISAMVVNCHTIKPIDRESIVEAARLTGAVVTAEEHQLMGGMGSAVSEVISTEYPVPMQMVGIRDRFGQSGQPDELMNAYGLNAGEIVKAAKKAIAMKR